ncbi:hypothetical protein [Streptomyces sp. NPDC048111]|uniref:hypothetical protein n=1 Tax=Streptomyces sp. NPDC048111 TaxID=3365500 RepID=UPI003717A74B
MSKRHERLRAWDIERDAGERLIATLGALVLHSLVSDAVATGSPRTVGVLHGIPLAAVAATTARPDFEILAAVPTAHTDPDEQAALNYVRLLTYQSGRTGPWLPRLRTELHHSLITLMGRSRLGTPTCADLSTWVGQARPT